MSCDGVLPKLDAAIFADTQAEPQEVYAHLEWCKEKAALAGIRVIVSTAGDLRADSLAKSQHGKRAAQLPFFLKHPETGKRGISMRQCTQDYKIRVVDKEIRGMLGLAYRQKWPKSPAVRQWMGISLDEVQRRRTSQRPAVQLWYPLIDGLKFTRQQCLDWMAVHNYGAPPRSACVFCPFHSDDEWLRMQRYSPSEFANAVEFDRLVRKHHHVRSGEKKQMRGEPYLHSSLIPLAMVKFSPASDQSEGRGMANECQGMCGV